MADALARKLRDPSLLVDKALINGNWVDSESGKRFNVHDPATGALLATCPDCTQSDTRAAITAASAALGPWRTLPGRARSRLLRAFHDLVLSHAPDLSLLISAENGKSRADADGEVLFAASFLEWFAEEAARIHGDVVPHSGGSARVHVLREPVGVCGLITPWNFPAAMVARKLGPALAAGCTVVVKSAGETPLTANALAVLALRAGIPKGVINVVTALEGTAAVGRVLCEDEGVRKISFTGSTRVGRLLMEQASGTVKKMSLELGGNAPFVVFDDAVGVEEAVRGLVASKFKVSGQTCVCANRVYVQEGIYDAFVKRLCEVVEGEFKIGCAAEAGVTHGPLIHEGAAARVAGLVDDAVAKGAKVLVGGGRMRDLGPAFFAPTVLTDVTPDMRIVSEEIFGPVAAIQRFRTEDEVLRLANDCEVGLAAYVYSESFARITRMTELLQAGMVAVNTGVISDAAAPFGGIKQSGIGREGSRHGIDDYMQMKTVVLGNVNVVHRANM